MEREKPGKTSNKSFPGVNRSIVTVRSIHEDSDEKAFWLSKTPLERLEAVELLRQIAFTYDPASTRLQRILEVTEFPPR